MKKQKNLKAKYFVSFHYLNKNTKGFGRGVFTFKGKNEQQMILEVEEQLEKYYNVEKVIILNFQRIK